MNRRDRMNRGTFIALGIAAIALAPVARAQQTHPDFTRYEYLFMNGQFVPPYTAFPSGRERSRWKCYDAKSRTTFDCTFVRGGFDNFDYIFLADADEHRDLGAARGSG
jgi:hypothetical protein